jgi:hypothetical protein
MWYIAYVDDVDVEFNASIHSIEKLEAFSVVISQREGEYATCLIETANPGIQEIFERRSANVLISTDNRTNGYVSELAFRGTLSAVPTDLAGDYITLEVTARRTAKELRNLGLQLVGRPDSQLSDIFVDIDKADNLDLIKGVAGNYYVDRFTREYKISDEIDAPWNPRFSFGPVNEDYILEGSLSLRVGELPPSKITQKFAVEWEQKKTGELDLAFPINNAIDRDTYIPNVTLEAMPGINWQSGNPSITAVEVIKRSTSFATSSLIGTTLLYSSTSPAPTNPYPITSKISVGEHRVGYDNFVVAYDFRQMRVENCIVECSANHSNILGNSGLEEELTPLVTSDITGEPQYFQKWQPNTFYPSNTRVSYNGKKYIVWIFHTSNNIFDASKFNDYIATDNFFDSYEADQPSFLETSRGQEAFKYSLALTSAEMKRRSRYIECSFEMEWDVGFDITTDQKLSVSHPQLPNRLATGKVTDYQLIDNGESRSCKVTIMIAATGARPDLNEIISSEYCSATYSTDYVEEYVIPNESINPNIVGIVGQTKPVLYNVEYGAVEGNGLPFIISNTWLIDQDKTKTISGGTSEQSAILSSALQGIKTSPVGTRFPGIFAGSDSEEDPDTGEVTQTKYYSPNFAQQNNDYFNEMGNIGFPPVDIEIAIRDIDPFSDTLERDVIIRSTIEIESGITI